MRTKRMWVDKDYHDRLKVEASLKGMSIIDYTKYLSNKEHKEDKDKKRGFNFDF